MPLADLQLDYAIFRRNNGCMRSAEMVRIDVSDTSMLEAIRRMEISARPKKQAANDLEPVLTPISFTYCGQRGTPNDRVNLALVLDWRQYQERGCPTNVPCPSSLA